MRRDPVSIRSWIPVVLWAAVILLAATDSFSASRTEDWLDFLFGGEAPEAANFIVRKLAHLVEYAILGALAFRASGRASIALAIALAVAGADEFRQSLSPHRTGTPWDVALDMVGAALGSVIMRWVAGRRVPSLRVRGEG